MTSDNTDNWQCPKCGRRYPGVVAGDLCPEDRQVLVPEETLSKYPRDPLLGETIDDRYRLFDVLGMGGFGAVYRSVEVVGGREVAIKTIRPGAEKKEADAHTRFLQEARLLAELENDNIVDVYHFGVAERHPQGGRPGDGLLYMVLELVPGLSLKHILRRDKTLSLPRTIDIIGQILMGLSHAHGRGLVHRDLKPGNILVVEGSQDRVKIIDFGIAKVLEADEEVDSPKTGTGLVLGTVRYMAPEQLREGQEIGPHTDLYSVGIMFYEMLTGQTPFDGSQAEIAAAHLYREPPPLPSSAFSPPMQNWFSQVMIKSGLERFPDASMMRLSLLKAYERSGERSNPDTIRMSAAGVQEMLQKMASQGEEDSAASDMQSRITPADEKSQKKANDSEKSQRIRKSEDEGRSVPDTVREMLPPHPGSRVTQNKKKLSIRTGVTEPGVEMASPTETHESDSPGWDGSVVPTSPLPVDGQAVVDHEKISRSHRTESSSIQTRGELGLNLDAESPQGKWWLAPSLVLIGLVAALVLIHPTDTGDLRSIESLEFSTGRSPEIIIDVPAIQDAALSAMVDAGAPVVGDHAPKGDLPASTPLEERTKAVSKGGDVAVGSVNSEAAAKTTSSPTKPSSSAPKKTAKKRSYQNSKKRRGTRSSNRSQRSKPTLRKTKGKKRNRAAQRKKQAEKKLEKAVFGQLDKCRCTRARMLVEQLPASFPSPRLMVMRERVEACRIPTVDQRCVEGRVE